MFKVINDNQMAETSATAGKPASDGLESAATREMNVTSSAASQDNDTSSGGGKQLIDVLASAPSKNTNLVTDRTLFSTADATGEAASAKADELQVSDCQDACSFVGTTDPVTECNQMTSESEPANTQDQEDLAPGGSQVSDVSTSSSSQMNQSSANSFFHAPGRKAGKKRKLSLPRDPAAPKRSAR